jgi:hypothetical protein
MLIGFKRGQASVILRVKILNSSVSTGAGLTGLTSASSGLVISTIADNEATATVYSVGSSNVEGITTLGTYAAPTSGKCRFKEVDATNHKGVYEIQIADARYAVSNAKSLLVSVYGATNAAETDVVIPLRDLDPYTSADSAVWAATLSELSSVPGVTADIKSAINWLFTKHRNKLTQTATTETVFKDNGSTTLATSTKSDDGTTFTRGEYS